MAASQSTEASEIRRRGRQRLIGAVAIALLLIVFVPMLLDSEPRPTRSEPKLEIPPRDNAPPLPAPVSALPSADSKAPVAAPTELPKPAAKVAVVEPKPGMKAATPKAAAAAPTTAAPAPATTAAPAPAPAKLEGFAIQVGAFADETKLAQVREKLAADKITAYTEPAGSLTRLRVGPFKTRDEAEKVAATVRKTVSEAKVVPLP